MARKALMKRNGKPAKGMAEWLRIAVGVPSRGDWTAETAVSVAKMVRHFTQGCAGEITIIAMDGFIVPEQRSRIWAQASQWKATHLLFVDTDMVFPDDALGRLLSHNKPIVAVNYPRKKYPFYPTAFKEGEDTIGPVFTRDDSTGLEEVKHCGFGLCLINMDVFDVLLADIDPRSPEMRDPPLFHFAPTASGTKWTTEDVYFCRKAREKGFKIYIDHDLSKQIGHIGKWQYENYQSESMEKAVKQEVSLGMEAPGQPFEKRAAG